ncbi:MAG TPA: OmpA family protein [Thiobacillaceae bacterium]|nr:OmpA family protein [Thiobacillaceae bacterium]
MRLRFGLSLILPTLLSLGCASQHTPDSEATAVNRQLDDMKQAQANLGTAQQNLEARITKLEAASAAQTARLDQVGPTSTELKNQLAALQGQNTAQQAALSAFSGRVDKQEAAVAEAREAADDAVKIARDSRMVSGKVVDSLTLTEDMVLYNYEQPELTQKGRAAMDELIARARPQLPYIFIEIIGYSDDVSLGSQNRRIAQERAESVRRYLFEVGGIPLHRMSVISYGALKPVDTDNSLEGRSRNRRVTVQVLK